MSDLPERLRADLTDAMRSRDRDKVRVLRIVLAAIANAEAQPTSDVPAPLGEGPIAGAVAGLGAAEAARRELTDTDVRALVTRERDELVEAGRDDDASLLSTYLG